MLKIVLIGSVLWPLLGVAVVRTRMAGATPTWTSVVYLAASRICHQRTERSFHTAAVQWPVCGRCSGLYVSAPFGLMWAVASQRRRQARTRTLRTSWVDAVHPPHRGVVLGLAVASLPTALTLLCEWTGALPIGNVARFAAALPLGTAVAVVIGDAMSGVSCQRIDPINRVN